MPSNDFDKTTADGERLRSQSDGPANRRDAEVLRSEIPVSIGGYEIEREIGRGGMSRVFRARASGQEFPVAIKVMEAGIAADSAMRQRFQREATAIQSLKHDHIIPLYAHGEQSGTPYLVMRLINGVTLSELIQYLRARSDSAGSSDTFLGADAEVSTCADRPASANASAAACFEASRSHDSIFKDLAELIATAAEALDEAHQNGIIHRDIKPSNMMLDRNGHLWLADFGLASVDEAHTVVTKSGEMIGTPHYMSPEQATADRQTIDYRTDLYSLGAALYELTTLTRPYQGDRFRVLMEISTGRLTPPSQACPEIPKPLEAIILKAMEYSPADRYQSGSAMADDLRRFARGKAISARQPQFADHAVRWLVRNPRLSIASVVAVTAVGFLIIAMMYLHSRSLEVVNSELEQQSQSIEERNLELAHAYDELGRSRNQLRQHLYVADVAAAYQAYANRDMDAVKQLLMRHVPQINAPGTNQDLDLRGYEWYLLYNLCQPPDGYTLGQHLGAARELAMIPGKAACLSVGDDGLVRHWDLVERKEQDRHEVGNNLDAIAVSPDGKLFVTGRNDSGSTSQLTIRRVDDGKVVCQLKGHEHSTESAAFSPDGSMVATADRYLDLFLHSTDGTFLGQQRNGARNESLAFTPDGQYLVACVRDENGVQSLKKYSVANLQPEGFSNRKPEKMWNIGFSPFVFAFSGNGQRILIGDGEQLGMYRWPDGKQLIAENKLRGRARCVAINHDGSKICTGCDNGSVYVWALDASPKASGSPPTLPLVIPTGNQPVTNVQLTDDDQVVITTEAGSIQVWKTVERRELPLTLNWSVRKIAPAKSDVDELVVRLSDGTVAKLDLLNQQCHVLQTVPPDRHQYVALSPDGNYIVASAPNELFAISAHDGRVIAQIKTGIQNDPTDGLVFTADGTHLIQLLNDRFEVYGVGPDEDCWRRTKEVLLKGDGVRGVTVSPTSGQFIVNLSATSELLVFDDETYEVIKPIPCQFGNFTAVQYSDDGELLALGCIDGTVEVLRTSDFQRLSLLRGHRLAVLDCIWMNGNQTLVTGSHDQIRFWDLPSERELGVLASDQCVDYLHYSLSQDSLFVFTENAPVQVWPTK